MTPAEVEAKLREADFQGPMQHLRSWSELDALHLAAADALAAQAAEIERMREALELCRGAFDTPIARRRYSDGDMTTAARNAIRQALSAKAE